MTDKVYAMCFSPDEKTIAVAGDELQLFDVNNCSSKQFKIANHGPIYAVAFSNDSKHIISGGEDGIVRIYESANGSQLANLDKSYGAIACIAVSPDGNTIATGDIKGCFRLWNGGVVEEHKLQSAITNISFNPAGTDALVLTHLDDVYHWDKQTGIQPFSLIGAYEKSITSRIRYIGYASNEPSIVILDSTQVLYKSSMQGVSVEVSRYFDYNHESLSIYSNDHNDLVLGLWLEPVNPIPRKSPTKKYILYVNDNIVTLLKHNRPDCWWGIVYLWQFWLAIFFLVNFALSIMRDYKGFRSSGDSAPKSNRDSASLLLTSLFVALRFAKWPDSPAPCCTMFRIM